MKVLFIAINSIHEHEDSEFLGYEILLSCLQQHKVEAEILHIEYKSVQEDITKYLEGIDFSTIAMIGINCMYSTLKYVTTICQHAKKINSKIHVTIGGALPSVASRDVLESLPDVDTVIIGEGERTICDLYNAVINGDDLSQCRGIAYRDNDTICLSPIRELIKDMDTIPYANRVMLEKNKYQFARIQSSRGCEGNCSFCAESRFMKDDTNIHWRGRSPKNVVSEMEEIKRKYGVDTFIFCDSSFEDPVHNGKQRMLDICREIKKRKLKVHFRVLFRSESVVKMEDELLEELKESGLFHVFLGIESGYEPALKIFHKRASVQDNAVAIEKIRRHKLNLTTGFIMFHPYTSIEEILENEKFIINNNLCFSTYSFISKMAVHKGAFIQTRAKEDGLLTENYSIFNPYEYVFKNPEVNEIYSLLQECFSVLRLNKAKELVNLLTYLEDDLRKKENEKGVNSFCKQYYSIIDNVKEEIGQKQLSLFQFAVHQEGNREKAESMVNILIETIEMSVWNLNKFHKEWMRFKIKNRIN